MNTLTILSIVFPLISGALLLFVRPDSDTVRKAWAIISVSLNSVFVLGTVAVTWICGKGATAFFIYRLSEHLSLAFAPDGASLIFGSIIGVLWPVTTIYAFSYMAHEHHLNKFYGFFIMTYGVVAGIAFSANFFTLYLCYELMTLATLPLVMHEMDDKARSAGRKYLIYSMSGAALIFVALVFLIYAGNTLDFTFGGVLDPTLVEGREGLMQTIFVFGFFGFGVKAGIFPLHDWLPSASVAPTPVTALLHAVAVVKSGAFAIMRLIYFCFGVEMLLGTPAQAVVVTASAVTIIFGSSMALRAPHLKRRLAYSTVANLSYILLAFSTMTPEGMTGGFLHMIFHAVIKITLFFCAGSVLHHAHLEQIDDLEGLGKIMPVTCGVFTFSALALMGIPPFGGFASKWIIGTAAAALGTWYGYVGASGLIVSAILTTLYMVTVIVRFYFPRQDRAVVTGGHEADGCMTVPLVFLCVLCLSLSLLVAHLTGFLSLVTGGAL